MLVMKNKKLVISAAVGLSAALVLNTSFAMNPNGGGTGIHTEAGKRVLERDGEYSKTSTLQLCVDYYKLTSQEKRDAYIKELDLRSQLSDKDHQLVSKHQVVPGMTMCGMYMSIGTPMAQETRQLRPMVYKTVHVYPDLYCVTQSGMVVETYERKEGTMPPKLSHEKPLVAPSPTLK